jgi:O-antigen ligase
MLHPYPFGKDLVDILTFSILVGIVVQKYGFPRTQNRPLIIFFLVYTYFELWMACFRYSLPMPITQASYQLVAFKNYVEMFMFYFLTVSLVSRENDQKKLLLIMGAVFLIINLQCYRNFTPGDLFNYDKRVEGGWGVVGLGPNHIGAFAAAFGAFFLGMFLNDNNRKRRLLFLSGVLLGLHPLLFSYSRGAYLGAFGVLVFFGLVKKRSLLVLAGVLVFSWTAILPSSVVDRIEMTESVPTEHGRLDLWRLALDLFEKNPITGVGFDGYALTEGGQEIYFTTSDQMGKLEPHQDAHNFFARTAAEQGVVGLFLLLALLFRAFQSGWRLYRTGDSQFQRSIGLGFAGCVVAFSITNIFGDRWSYYVLGSYFWVLFGMVDASLCLKQGQTVPVVKVPFRQGINTYGE